MDRVVNVQEAKTQLSRLLKQVAAGEEITLARAGVPIAKLVPITAGRRHPGRGRDRIVLHPDFDAPLPDDVIDGFEGVEP
jgi:prevent-host-death family protein